ncbi:MAG TPA: hypothetical protein VK348_12325, partial [Planctomycetota bacterium]|nr:hypothetical protein [Planctomycetota bacterium]
MARRQTWCWLLVAAALAFGLWRAIDRRWLCDDAFISFRYARNLADGLGLVFNAEERVEGFSNFLWTLLCALATALGGDPVAFAQWLGIACFAATVPVTVWAGRRLLPDAPCLPLAAASVALHAHLQEFASCGLETAAFVLVVTALTGVVAGAAGTRAWLLAGLLAAIAALLRPDGAIFGLLGGCAALAAVRRQRRWRPLAYVLPGIGLFVPFLLWRYVYYGELLPNTFYAKSADEPYAGQGLRYCWLFFTSYWVLLPALPALVVLALRRGSRRAGVWLLGCTLAYCGFVVWVGGDFMFARFLLPVMPLLYLALELAARTLLPARFGIPALVLVAVATLLWQPHARLMGVFQNGQVVGDLQSHRIHG